MNTTEKLTKKQKFTMLMGIDAVKENDILREFVEHELELLEKKNASKSTKTTAKQEQNSVIGEQVVDFMSPNTLYTMSELLKKVPGLPEDMSLPRLTRIVTDMVNDGRIVRTVDKRKAYFSLP
jgi:hypothetical protein